MIELGGMIYHLKDRLVVIQTTIKNFQIKFPVSRKTGADLKFLVVRLISTEKSNDNLCNWSFKLKKPDFSKWKPVLQAIFGTSLAEFFLKNFAKKYKKLQKK